MPAILTEYLLNKFNTFLLNFFPTAPSYLFAMYTGLYQKANDCQVQRDKDLIVCNYFQNQTPEMVKIHISGVSACHCSRCCMACSKKFIFARLRSRNHNEIPEEYERQFDRKQSLSCVHPDCWSIRRQSAAP